MSGESRPSAEQLLARLQTQERPRLRVYLGAAPGVGKTYTMLEDARALKARGIDVVVGFVETYGRAETEAQSATSKSCRGVACPTRRRARRDGPRRILARKPQLCVVDELAHTNVPGSRHEKRYQECWSCWSGASA